MEFLKILSILLFLSTLSAQQLPKSTQIEISYNGLEEKDHNITITNDSELIINLYEYRNTGNSWDYESDCGDRITIKKDHFETSYTYNGWEDNKKN